MPKPRIVRNKTGLKAPEYMGFSIHPAIDKIMKNTHGIMIYQENLMQLYAIATGKTLEESDEARRAITKYKPGNKKTEEPFFKVRDEIMNGLEKNLGLTKNQSHYIMEKIMASAGYGFNKAHAIAYSVITLKTLYYKHKYPAHFYAALLNAAYGDKDKTQQIIFEILTEGFQINNASLNSDPIKYKVIGDEIYAPLTSLNGVSETIAIAISSVAPFKDANDFMNRINLSRVNDRIRAILYKAGMFSEKDFPILDINPRSILLTPEDFTFGNFENSLKEVTFPRGKKKKYIDHIYSVLGGLEDSLESFIEEEEIVSKVYEILGTKKIKGLFEVTKNRIQEFCYTYIIPNKFITEYLKKFSPFGNPAFGMVTKIENVEFDGTKAIKIYLHDIAAKYYVYEYMPIYANFDLQVGNWVMIYRKGNTKGVDFYNVISE